MGVLAIKKELDIKFNVQRKKDNTICIGSDYVHNLIILTKKDGNWNIEFNPIFDFNDDSNSSILYRKLRDLKKESPNKFNEILDKDDSEYLGILLPVYTFNNGKIVKTYCDSYGYPNTDIDGYMMYDNTYFQHKKDCIVKARREYRCGIKMSISFIKNTMKEVFSFFLDLFRETYFLLRTFI